VVVDAPAETEQANARLGTEVAAYHGLEINTDKAATALQYAGGDGTFLRARLSLCHRPNAERRQ